MNASDVNEPPELSSGSPPTRRLAVLIIGGFVRDIPWSETLWLPDLARALARRGHAVEVMVDGCDDVRAFDGIALTVLRPGRTHFGADPFVLRRAARELMRARAQSVTLSMTPLVCGDVWMPLGARARDVVGQLLRTHHPIGAMVELSHHPWLLHELLAERRAVAERPRRRSEPLTIGPHGPQSVLRSLGYAARVEPLSGETREAARAATRAALGLGESELVLLVSGTHATAAEARGLFGGLATLMRSRLGPADAGLRVVLTGRQPFSLLREAERAGVLDSVVHAGSCVRMDAMMAASDLCVAAFGEAAGGTGRFVSEAIRAGLPVIAHERAAGSDLVDSGLSKPGLVVHERTSEAWLAGLGRALDPAWLEARRRACRGMAADLTIDRLAARVESYLVGALR